MITNAKDGTIDEPVLIGMQSAFTGLFRPVKFLRVTRTLENYVETETVTVSQFQGVIQPMKERQLKMKPEGQRSWRWFTVHAEIGLKLGIDEIMWIKNIQYRIMEIWQWASYGFVEYHVIQDFQDRSTAPPVPNAALQKFLQDVVVTSPLTVDVDVSGSISDATEAIWKLYNSSNEIMVGSVTVVDLETVRIEVLAAGTYRLIGEG